MSVLESAQVEPQPRKTAGRKVKAIVAAGIVLGIGAATTLANWTDVQLAEGAFGVGHYQVQSSVSGTGDWDSHTDGAATLTFNADNVAPNDKFAASLWLRTDKNTSYDGVLNSLTANTNDSGSPDIFNLSVLDIPADETCSHDLTRGNDVTPIIENRTLSFSAQTLDIRLENYDDKAGKPIQLCFQVTAPGQDELKNTGTTSVTWSANTTSAGN